MKHCFPHFLTRLLLLTLVLTTAEGVRGQQQKARPTPPPATEQDDQSEKIFIRRVRVPITVVDKKGQFVAGLTQKDFVILEDRVPQQIETFSDDRGQSLPVYVAVLMDTSPSTAGKLKFEQESAMNFIQTVVRARKDQVLFATFDHEINLRQDFTSKLDLLDRAVSNIKSTGNQTALFDAIWQFCDEKLRTAAGRLSLERSFNKISKELRAQYLVTYKPLNDRYDGSFRKVEVKLAEGRKDLKVRTKHGYTAKADSVRP